jgi:1,4-alpha-glucan branching enzyme
MYKTGQQNTGYLGILLHAHLPFVNRREGPPSFEEKWLFEALTESYIPMIMSWEKLALEGVNFHLTLSLSPTLLSMLTDPAVIERYCQHLDRLKDLAEREVERTRQDSKFQEVATFYWDRIHQIDRRFKSIYHADLVRPLNRLHDQGHIEMITTCATHGFLPLMLTKEAQSAQVRIALDLFKEVFGRLPMGLWLPECGYAPGIEKILESHGIRYFTVASHGMLNAWPKPKTGVYAPLRLAGTQQIAAFGRDWETSHQVWSRTQGYPGDPNYREFYRDIGYDLDYQYIGPYLTGNTRGDTGFKYYRITGDTPHKEVYCREAALRKIKEHAADFWLNRERQIAHLTESGIQHPIVVAPYDAELFGHWWFEGPEWLEELLRLGDRPERRVRLTTLQDYLAQFPPDQEVSMAPSSWGSGGYNKVWLNPSNDWIYPQLHRAEQFLVTLADRYTQPSELEKRAMNQAVRELLVAQSSDWPFIITNQTVVDYAKRRLKEHLENFEKLTTGLVKGSINADFLSALENRNKIFSRADYRLYRSFSTVDLKSGHEEHPTVLMLSWEYPPRHVGGLGIHVRDLAETLVQQNYNVHVLTLDSGEKAHSYMRNGVHIHALAIPHQHENESDFLSWMLQYNIAMADFGRRLIRRMSKSPIIIHAHDWMVSYAARELQQYFGLPLIATIHATEYGRNNGLHNETQRAIGRLESALVNSADQVICCSRSMEKEIQRLFRTEPIKINVIPNAVGSIPYQEISRNSREILFIGRLVVEKGVQILIEAFARLLTDYPNAHLTIAGSGPYAPNLHQQVEDLGIASSVNFTGFVSEDVRNQLLARCQVAVFPSLYEPFGIVALEAMAAGVPVIASRTGGLAETVDDLKTGLLSPPGDVEALRQSLAQLFDDPALAKTLVQNAHAKVERDYSWEAVAKQTRAIYQKQLKKQRSQAS